MLNETVTPVGSSRDHSARLPSTSSTKARRRRKPLHGSYGWFLVPAGIFLLATAAYPLVTLVRMAFGAVNVSNLGGSWALTGFKNFRQVISSPEFVPVVKTTFYFTGALLVVDLVLGYIIAEWIRKPTRLASATQTVLMMGWALPVVVSGTIWRFLLDDDGLVNDILHSVGLGSVLWLTSSKMALWGVLLAVAWGSLPFCATILKGGLLSIPIDTLEAAAIDGANRWKTIRRVILPQMRSTIMTLALLIIFFGFAGSFAFIDVMTAGGPGTATVTLPFFGYVDSFTTFQFGDGAALALMSMGFVALLAVAVIRLSRETWRS